MIQKISPFNSNGTFKKGNGYTIVNREVCKPQPSPTGIKLLPVYKQFGKPWTAFDNPHIIKRLIGLGMTIELIHARTNYSTSYLDMLNRNSGKMSDRALYKLMEIEATFKGE